MKPVSRNPGTLFVKSEKAGGRYIYYVALQENNSQLMVSSHISRQYADAMMRKMKAKFKNELKNYQTNKQHIHTWLINFALQNSTPEFALR